MTAEDQKALDDKHEAEKLVASVPLPPEIDSVQVELYTDNTGDPSFQLVFRLRPGTETDDAFFDRYLSYKGLVQTKILHSELGRFPYGHLEEAA